MEIPLYQGYMEDNTRWNGFPFRDDDIVIVTKGKCGTTWVQMLLALMIFRTPEFPNPLWNMSQWIDHTGDPVQQVFADLEAQQHRRFIKTHTPLWAVPHSPGVKYLMVTRDPLDMTLSWYHHLKNQKHATLKAFMTPADYVREFVYDTTEKSELTGTVFSTGFALTHPDPDLMMIRYEDLLTDTHLEAKRIAGFLGMEPLDDRLLASAKIGEMRKNSGRLAPLPNTFKDTSKFFRSGSMGTGRKLLSRREHDFYLSRMNEYPDVGRWYGCLR